MPSMLFAGHAVALAAEHAHANGGVGMPPGLRSVPEVTQYFRQPVSV
ncbi:MAG: hypothetical protein NTX87_07555 [Planctomycetota bacterium]|nr:hypothetical protein [Planctomycetota bacterium]